MMTKLSEYRNILWNCSKCAMCRTISPWDMKSKQFSAICPSGTKFLFEAYYAPGKMEIVRALIDEDLTYSERLMHVVFACTLCGGCQAQCDAVNIIKPLDVLQELRNQIVKELGPLPPHKRFAKSIEQNHNPYHEPHETRFDGLREKLKDNPAAKVAYFIGCTSSYREKQIAESTIALLNHFKINYTTLDSDEWCCGSPLFMSGQKDEGIKQMHHNLEAIQKRNFNTVIFSCAGCYRTFKTIYPQYQYFNFKVSHVTEFLPKYVRKFRKKMKKLNETVTYHDPCHLGRHSGVFDAPRQIIQMIPGIQFVEMERIKQNAWCCGSGGGVRSAYQEFALWTAEQRIIEARATGANILLSACPFCEKNFKEAKSEAMDGLKFYDITEFLRRLLMDE